MKLQTLLDWQDKNVKGLKEDLNERIDNTRSQLTEADERIEGSVRDNLDNIKKEVQKKGQDTDKKILELKTIVN